MSAPKIEYETPSGFNYDVTDDMEDDFLSGVSANPVPSACSLDNPECEACQ